MDKLDMGQVHTAKPQKKAVTKDAWLKLGTTDGIPELDSPSSYFSIVNESVKLTHNHASNTNYEAKIVDGQRVLILRAKVISTKCKGKNCEDCCGCAHECHNKKVK